jgi:MHS family proline/betaine transporter-like MFS transporter
VPGVVVIVARRYLEETEDFVAHAKESAEQKRDERSSAAEEGVTVKNVNLAEEVAHTEPLWELIENYKLPLIIGSLGTAGIGAFWYVLPFYSMSFIETHDDLKPRVATLGGLLAYLFPTILAPVVGKLVDVWGASRVHTLALLGGCVLAPIPVLYWWTHVAQDKASLSVVIGQCILGLLMSLTTSVYLWVVELFPVHVRVTGVSVAYNIGIGIFGGVGPLISDALNNMISPKSLIDAPAAYTILTGLTSLCAVAASRVLASKGMMKLTHIRESPY